MVDYQQHATHLQAFASVCLLLYPRCGVALSLFCAYICRPAVNGWSCQDIQPGNVVAWPTNLGWMMGPWLIYATLLNRATIALFLGAPTGRPFCEFVAYARVTMLGVVPSIVKAWRIGDCAAGLDWSAIRCFSSSGEVRRTGWQAPCHCAPGCVQAAHRDSYSATYCTRPDASATRECHTRSNGVLGARNLQDCRMRCCLYWGICDGRCCAVLFHAAQKALALARCHRFCISR